MGNDGSMIFTIIIQVLKNQITCTTFVIFTDNFILCTTLRLQDSCPSVAEYGQLLVTKTNSSPPLNRKTTKRRELKTQSRGKIFNKLQGNQR